MSIWSIFPNIFSSEIEKFKGDHGVILARKREITNITELLYIFIYIAYIYTRYCREAKARLYSGRKPWPKQTILYNETAHKQKWGKKSWGWTNRRVRAAIGNSRPGDLGRSFVKFPGAPRQEWAPTPQEQPSYPEAALPLPQPSGPGSSARDAAPSCSCGQARRHPLMLLTPSASLRSAQLAWGTTTLERSHSAALGCTSCRGHGRAEQNRWTSSTHVAFYFIWYNVFKFTKCSQVFLQGQCGYSHTTPFCPNLVS